MDNILDQLRKMTKIVVDTGDINAIRNLAPIDATTNPSLLYTAVQDPAYKHLVEEAITFSRKLSGTSEERMEILIDKLMVNFGLEILKLVQGRVSTEVNAGLSFNVKGSIEKAQSLIDLYESNGISRERVLIKLASTWEGIQAAKKLEKMGIHCNMTLLFSLPQAIECAKAKATLISPFVGRILDWFKKSEAVAAYPPEQDPGVLSVKQIYNYFKKYGYTTQVMGASFRNVDEIIELAGCDLLTISPTLLQELQKKEGILVRKLDPKLSKKEKMKKLAFNESSFRFHLNDNAMATEKLAEGIRVFAKDTVKLENYIRTTFVI
jgi:transaldolase